MTRRISGIFNLGKRIRVNWRRHYSLIIRQKENHREVFSLRLTPRNIFVIFVLSFLIVMTITSSLIVFTPLRYYIPGYSNPQQYQQYKKLTLYLDSLDRESVQNQIFLDNIHKVLDEELDYLSDDTTQQDKIEASGNIDVAAQTEARSWVHHEAAKIQMEIVARNAQQTIPILQQEGVQTLTISPPTVGKVISTFDPNFHFGIDIANKKNTLITAIADGTVIFAGFSISDGNTVIIQHKNGVLSFYQRNQSLLVKQGEVVSIGTPIAKMGATGSEEEGTHLHFEIWSNNTPIDPLKYSVTF